VIERRPAKRIQFIGIEQIVQEIGERTGVAGDLHHGTQGISGSGQVVRGEGGLKLEVGRQNRPGRRGIELLRRNRARAARPRVLRAGAPPAKARREHGPQVNPLISISDFAMAESTPSS
jgi:hypothetical protein